MKKNLNLILLTSMLNLSACNNVDKNNSLLIDNFTLSEDYNILCSNQNGNLIRYFKDEDGFINKEYKLKEGDKFGIRELSLVFPLQFQLENLKTNSYECNLEKKSRLAHSQEKLTKKR